MCPQVVRSYWYFKGALLLLDPEARGINACLKCGWLYTSQHSVLYQMTSAAPLWEPQIPYFITSFVFRITHYAKQSDIQMAAMLCCAFGCRAENQDTLKSRQLSKSVNVSVSITVIVHYSMCLLLHFQLMELELNVRHIVRWHVYVTSYLDVTISNLYSSLVHFYFVITVMLLSSWTG